MASLGTMVDVTMELATGTGRQQGGTSKTQEVEARGGVLASVLGSPAGVNTLLPT